MGIFSGKNRFKMDALRIKERGSKNTPTNFSEGAVEFMKGMPGYNPQFTEDSDKEKARPPISNIKDSDIQNKKVVKRDGGQYITGQVVVEGEDRPNTESYQKVFDSFEQDESGLYINPITGAKYKNIEEFIKDAQKSDQEQGYGTQTFDVDREINYAKNWKSNFWVWGFKPDIVQQRHNEDPDYISPAAKSVMSQLEGKNRTIRDSEGVYRGDRLNILYKSLLSADMLKEGDYDWKELGTQETTKILTRLYDELILKNPDKAAQIYKLMRMRTGKSSGKTVTGGSPATDTGWQYTSD